MKANMENIEYDNDIIFVCLRLYLPEVGTTNGVYSFEDWDYY